jgi:SAM-dependent MidA family methyltransferase
MIEASPTLRDMQRKLLCGDNTNLTATDGGYRGPSLWRQLPIFWYETISEIPRDGVPTFIVAHEFFDALPIFSFENTVDGWKERLVGYDNVARKFFLASSKESTPMAQVVTKSHQRYEKLGVGSKVEVCPEGWDIAEQLAQIIDKCGGSALVVDYGPADTIPVETLRAIKDHRIVSPFEGPGEADLSADVDFQGLKIAATYNNSVDVVGPVEQGDWLHQLGIGARATALANSQTDTAAKKRIAQAYNRLVEKGGGAMGKIYKVMGIVPKGAPAPIGFGGGVQE